MDWREHLNEAQSDAVRHGSGPLLVLAGPGSGKTRVITSRIAQLLHDNPSDQILALTFTNKAADEMKARVGRQAQTGQVWISTFHRFCSRLLRQHAALVGLTENFTIYDTDDSVAVLKRVVDQDEMATSRHTPRQLLNVISQIKNEAVGIDEAPSWGVTPLQQIAARVYPHYQKQLLRSNAVDFDDLILLAATLLRDNQLLRADLDRHFRFVLVDEYQDTNLSQYAIVRALSLLEPNLTVTGDPDQSIYAWRGATLRNILQFERDYPDAHVVRLEENYRSTPNILLIADSLISRNTQRKHKTLFTANSRGSDVRVVEYATGASEAAGIVEQIAKAIEQGAHSARDHAILFRTNALTRQFEHEFRTHGIPYQIVHGVEFYKRREVKDVLAYLQWIANPKDDVALLRAIKAPSRGIGRVTLDRVRRHAEEQQLSLGEALVDAQLLSTLSSRPAKSLKRFANQLGAMRDRIAEPVADLVNFVLVESGYRDALEEANTEEDAQRKANVEELVSAARDYDSQRDSEENGLDGFLEQAALVNETDDWASASDKVTLMTLHAAKGLEFPVVYIAAVEENIIPHARSIERLDQIEEERRLLFVGITRAKSILQLSFTRYRQNRGVDRRQVVSSFMGEIPQEAIAVEREEAMCWHEPDAYASYSRRETRLPPTRREPLAAPARVMTAAQLTGEAAAPPVDPQHFSLGMMVSHPTYGAGKIVDLTGTGKRRYAAVQFFQPPHKQSFSLAHSPLQPVQAPAADTSS